MKKFKTIFIAIALILGSVTFAQAQDSKVAHIAAQELIEMMPGYKAAMTELEQLQNTYSSSIEDMMKEAQALNQKYQSEATTKTDEENAQRAMELEETKSKILEYRQNASRKLQQKEMELLQPVLEKARTTIQKVAREKGYDYVLDSTTGTGVLLADGFDLLPAVKKELGIQ